MIKLIAIDRDNLFDLIDLRVAPEQEELIAPNAEWIAEACYAPECKTFGIAWKDRPVGLITLVDPRSASPEDVDDFQPGCAMLWRIMIDHRFQGRGFGAKALSLVMDQVRADGFRGLTLGVADGKPGNALAFYRKHGFEPTGRRDDDEIELCRCFETSPESERDERSKC